VLGNRLADRVSFDRHLAAGRNDGHKMKALELF
jgi:hypothetical protein